MIFIGGIEQAIGILDVSLSEMIEDLEGKDFFVVSVDATERRQNIHECHWRVLVGGDKSDASTLEYIKRSLFSPKP